MVCTNFRLAGVGMLRDPTQQALKHTCAQTATVQNNNPSQMQSDKTIVYLRINVCTISPVLFFSKQNDTEAGRNLAKTLVIDPECVDFAKMS